MSKTYVFAEDRTTFVKEQLIEDDEGAEGGKDISGADWSAKFRMFRHRSETAPLLNVSLTIVALTGSDLDYPDTGTKKSGVQGYITPEAAYGSVTCRYVLIDGATVDAKTISGYREFVFGTEWTTQVSGSVQPAP